jgi:hypothetical protein
MCVFLSHLLSHCYNCPFGINSSDFEYHRCMCYSHGCLAEDMFGISLYFIVYNFTILLLHIKLPKHQDALYLKRTGPEVLNTYHLTCVFESSLTFLFVFVILSTPHPSVVTTS